MSFLTILQTIFIEPLKLVFEIIFTLANKFIDHPGLSIIVLSLIMNFLVLPLYRRADIMQEKERDTQARLSKGIAHIKKTFTGDEKMMILQTYYRQNDYKPTDALNGSVSLLLEIPFFMAAYQFLSNLKILQGVSLGPIKDLGAPDAMFMIGDFAVNVLPILMTLVNVISSAIYLKGFPLKTKIQLYGMAAFFLVFLYTSPSGLVFYWTLNNVFSLGKTIFYKLKNPGKVFGIISSIVGAIFLYLATFGYETVSLKRKFFLLALALGLQLPLVFDLIKNKIKKPKKEVKNNKKIFVLGSLFLTVLVGLLIPSTIISASPQEFIDVSYLHNPLWYLVSSTSLAAGFFLVWMGVFYWLASPSGKAVFDKLVWILCGVTVVNYMFFGTDLGIIFSNLQYENGLDFTFVQQLINLAVIAAVALVFYFIIRKFKNALAPILLTAVIALTGMGGYNIYKAIEPINNTKTQSEELSQNTPHFALSKEGKNVVILMLDRAINQYIPYMMKEKPELKDKLDGFTYYENVLSFGASTNFGAPALYGGYEYTPEEINKRKDEPLVDKHNEALKVLPVIYDKNGYEVTVCDPSYAGYQWVPDLSIYDEYPDINAYITDGAFSDIESKVSKVNNNHRNFFCFSIMKCMPLMAQEVIYDRGLYNQADVFRAAGVYSVQVTDGISKAEGLAEPFMNAYNVLTNLSQMTEIVSEEKNTFLMLANNATHEPMLLQAPDYVPSEIVDNTEYDAKNKDRFVIDGDELKITNEKDMIHYHSNLAALLKLGDWFDYLRANDLYDNTKIIIVSDHAKYSEEKAEYILGPEWDTLKNTGCYYPLLMVKDFNAKGFNVSEEFMTNADVPTIATKDTVENPVNPFTNKPINNDEKYAHGQLVLASWEWDVLENNGNQFNPARWFSVKDDMRKKENWTFNEEITTTPPAH